jgi:hypothetical protein
MGAAICCTSDFGNTRDFASSSAAKRKAAFEKRFMQGGDVLVSQQRAGTGGGATASAGTPMAVTLPPGAYSGQNIDIMLANGSKINMTVPPGAREGEVFQIHVPDSLMINSSAPPMSTLFAPVAVNQYVYNAHVVSEADISIDTGYAQGYAGASAPGKHMVY